MATIIFLFILLAFYHFYMESFVIPIKHMEIRGRFECLKYEAIEAHKKNEKMSVDLLIDFQNSLAITSTFTPHLNILSHFKYRLKMTKKEVEEIESKSNEMSALLSNPDNKVFRKFLSDYNKIVGAAFLVNLGGWVIYAMPLLILHKIYNFCASLKNPFINKKVTEYLLNKKEYSNLSKSQPSLTGSLAW